MKQYTHITPGTAKPYFTAHWTAIRVDVVMFIDHFQKMVKQ